LQQGPSYATRVYGERWISVSTSDGDTGRTSGSSQSGDAFDIYVAFEHGGDFKKVVTEWGRTMRQREGSRLGTSVGPTSSEGARQNTTQTSVHLVRASDIQPEAITWLWPGFLAQGKMHVLAGAPGTGKTTIALRLAAIVSAGGRWPDGSYCPAGNVVMWSAEDDVKDTLVPRLLAAGADMNRVHFVSDVRDGGGARSFDPARDFPALQAAIKQAGGSSLLIVDPIVSAVAGDGHKANDVRRGLQPLVELAMAERCALLGITHFSKGTSGRDPLERVTGSQAFGALARVVFVAATEQKGDEQDSNSPPRRYFLRCKSNIGRDSGGFEYSLEQQTLDAFDGMCASVATCGAAVEGDTKTILTDAETDPNDGDGGAFSEAKDWLLDFLVDGPRWVKDVQTAGSGAGHSWSTLRRAKQALGVKPRKAGMKDRWEWFYPGAMSEFPEGAQ
jgi:putative DNA primase/helicase